MSFGSSFTPYNEASILGSALGWLQGTLLGSVAIGLCAIAVAIVGLMMFEGRLPIRQGARVILGCFVLLGAPVIASGFLGFWQGGASPPSGEVPAEVVGAPRDDLPPADFDPYAGASLRRD